MRFTPEVQTVLHKKLQFSHLTLEQRVLAAYYRAGGVEHPDHSKTALYVVEYDAGDGRRGFRSYVRLADDKATLAVFRFNEWEELKRLKRWPKSIDDGSAMTDAQFNEWFEEATKQAAEARARAKDDAELDALIDDLDGPLEIAA